MVKMLGNYEIDLENSFVRLKIEDDYEYLVSKDIHGKNAHSVCRIFEYAFYRGREDIQSQLRSLLGK